MYHQPWNITMPVRGEQEAGNYSRENKLPLMSAMDRHTSTPSTQDLQRKGNELACFLLYDRNLLLRNNKLAQRYKSFSSKTYYSFWWQKQCWKEKIAQTRRGRLKLLIKIYLQTHKDLGDVFPFPLLTKNWAQTYKVSNSSAEAEFFHTPLEIVASSKVAVKQRRC